MATLAPSAVVRPFVRIGRFLFLDHDHSGPQTAMDFDCRDLAQLVGIVAGQGDGCNV